MESNINTKTEIYQVDVLNSKLTIEIIENKNSDKDLPALLLCHGLASNRLMLRECAIILHTKYSFPVCLVDLRGHGDSSTTTIGNDGFNLSQNADDLISVIAFIRNLQNVSSHWKQPIIFCGHSYGGNVVLEVSYKYPSYTRGIICIDGGFINLSKLYSSYSDCEMHLKPPSFEGMIVSDLDSALRDKWCIGWSEVSLQAMKNNFALIKTLGIMTCCPGAPNGYINDINEDDQSFWLITPKLNLERHLLLLHDLYNNSPLLKFQSIESPVLFIAAGDGGRTCFSDNKANDITTAISLIPTASKAVWFPESPHDVITLFPIETADVIYSNITHFF